MITVSVSIPQQAHERGRPVISATIDVAGERYDVHIRSSHGPLTSSADPFVALALLPAMRLGAELHCAGRVSARLLRHLPQMQEIIATWFKEFHTVPVHGCAEATPATAAGNGVGCFFSGGIDSSYSALKHGDELTDLIFVRGFDIALDDSVLWPKVLPAMQRAAANQRKSLIVVDTNCRALLDTYAPWTLSHGPALASVALALSPQLRTIYIAASDSYAVLEPYGSHPLLDPLWSTEQTDVIHDGCEMDRWQKLDHLVSSEAALSWLRVCWQNRSGAYNCCQCLKCVEAMLYLEANGALRRCPTFDRPLDLHLLQRLEIRPDDVVYTRALLAAIERKAPHRHDLADAVGSRIALSQQDGGPMPTSMSLPRPQVAALEERLQHTHTRINQLAQRVHMIMESRSWRLSAPLRSAATHVQQLSDGFTSRRQWAKVIVATPRQHYEGGWPAVSALIDVDGYRYDITIRASQGPLTARGRSVHRACSLARQCGLAPTCTLRRPVSPRLLRNLSRIQDVMCCWYRDFHKVAIVATAQARYAALQLPASAVGCFFFWRRGFIVHGSTPPGRISPT